MFRFKILQVRLEHAKEKIDIVGRLRNFENTLVILFVRKSDPQGQFFGDEINRAQPHGELLQKAAQHKKERLGRFNFIFKLETFGKRFRGLDSLEKPRRFSVSAFPKTNCFRPEPGAEILLIERGELSKRVNAPFVQDLQDLPNLSLSISRRNKALHAPNLRSRLRYVQVNIQSRNPLFGSIGQRLAEVFKIDSGNEYSVNGPCGNYFFFQCAPPSSGNTNRFARISMTQPASTTRPKRCVGGKSDNTKMAKPAAKITSE